VSDLLQLVYVAAVPTLLYVCGSGSDGRLFWWCGDGRFLVVVVELSTIRVEGVRLRRWRWYYGGGGDVCDGEVWLW
jgi:hypothetical protein